MFQEQFNTLTAVGVWCRPTWTSSFIFFYRLYFFTTYLSAIFVGITQVALLVQVRNDFKEFNDNITVAVSYNIGWIKGIFIMLMQKRIFVLINMFKSKYFSFQSSEEEHIQKKYDDFCRVLSLGLLSLVEITIVAMILVPLNGGFEKGGFMYNVRLPYNISKPRNYWLTLAHQGIGTVYTSNASITADTLIASFMMQVCSQIEIFKHRIKQLPVIIDNAYTNSKSQRMPNILERQLLSQHVQHHLHIMKLANGVCSTFYEIVVCQFFVSAFTISVLLVSVSRLPLVKSNTTEILFYALYFTCVLNQFFIYCFFGNQVTAQSISIGTTVFDIDWTLLSPRAIKDLTIMHSTCKPINISCGPFIHLTLESFSKILKLSYSAFNFLKQSA